MNPLRFLPFVLLLGNVPAQESGSLS